jgi:uroporphyrinogen decarboxylase
MNYKSCDRVPYFEEGLRKAVIAAWHAQGMPHTQIRELFPFDSRREIAPDLEARPKPEKWPTSLAGLDGFQKHFNASDTGRFPADWEKQCRLLAADDTVTMLRVHRGLFLSLGVYGWRRFAEIARLLVEKPNFVKQAMALQGTFAARMAEKTLRAIRIDAAVFSEPIGGNNGPLISPHMYADIVLPSYGPLLTVLKQYNVKTIIFRTYGNARILIPTLLKFGFNCLWACEVNIEAMDYRSLRTEFGRDLRLIGGIDLDTLRRGRSAIRKEIEEKVPWLIADGGYIPLTDGRIREDLPYENYRYYRQVLSDFVHPGKPGPN